MTAVEYSIVLAPKVALLGEPIMAELRCASRSDAGKTLTFDHRSLVIELDRDGFAEPAVIFPNRYAIEHGGRLLRVASHGGVEELAAGEERSRAFDLALLFPAPVLNVGRFVVTYRLEAAQPMVRPAPVADCSVELRGAPALRLSRTHH